MRFERASRRKAHLKIAITGPTGAGKTYSAILLAKGLAKGGKIAFIDTENRSGDLYSHLTEYDSGTLEPPFDTTKYMAAIDAAVEAGYSVIVIDSFSHAWKAILAEKEAIDARGGNSFTNWARLKPKTEALKNKIINAPAHIIACMRSKMEYALEQDGNRSKVSKMGMGVVQESDIEYEFTTVFDLDMTHRYLATKDRTSIFDGRKGEMITEGTGREFLTWLDSGAEPLPVTETPPAETPEPVDRNGTTPKDWLMSILTTKAQRDKWTATAEKLGMKPVEAAEKAMNAGVRDAGELFDWAALATPVVAE